MAAARSAAQRVEWAKVANSLGLKGATLNSLNAFKKRSDDARRRIAQLEAQPQSVDFAHYRSVLRNKSIVDDVEKAMKDFKVQKVDVQRQVKAIEAFEQVAIKNAEDTKKTIDEQIATLEKTVKNIEEARPIEEITVDDMFQAAPELEARTERQIKHGKWVVPGYKERFGDLSVL